MNKIIQKNASPIYKGTIMGLLSKNVSETAFIGKTNYSNFDNINTLFLITSYGIVNVGYPMCAYSLELAIEVDRFVDLEIRVIERKEQ